MEQLQQITSTLQMLLSSLEPSGDRAMVLRWKEEAELKATRREQRLKIISAVREGYDTLAELKSETGIPRSTCHKILRRLVADNTVRKTVVRNANNRFEMRFEIAVKE